ncbi:hypothetical protein [Leifsonia sp. LS-T14]|uniref:hypothetical protein n=1 Tax=unclassified Leifsonia TaxID=2663824 RepID=UPI0035A602B1
MSGDALVGATGFVGGNLMRSHAFTDAFSSANIADMEGRDYDLVVFSAARAEKWRINQDPEADLVHIRELERILTTFRTRRLVLVSTVDVYGHPVGVDELTPVPEPGLHPYGAHRLELEEFARGRFDDVLVARLPGLFGPGIKKNVIYDLLHDNGLDRVDRRGSFQYYDLTRLWDDLQVALQHRLTLLNLATEPVTTEVVARECFGVEFANELPSSPPGRYDMRTIHAGAFGRTGPYLYSADEILAALREFVSSERNAA